MLLNCGAGEYSLESHDCKEIKQSTISCLQATTPYEQRAGVIAIRATASVAEKEGCFKFAQIMNPG